MVQKLLGHADIATTQMPTTMKSALWWSEYIWTVQGTYRMAMERIVSYFITDLEIDGNRDNRTPAENPNHSFFLEGAIEGAERAESRVEGEGEDRHIGLARVGQRRLDRG